MKIVAVMGSPHAGNTLDLTQKIEGKLKHLGEVDFEYIHLKDMDIKPCKGCFACFMKGVEVCPLKDDMPQISAKLHEADGVIFVSPVYALSVSYLFKLFIDRMAYNLHRPCFFDKYAISLMATGGVGLNESMKYMKEILVGLGFNVVDELGYYAVPKNTTLRDFMESKDRADEVAGKFYNAIKDKRPRTLKTSDYLHFHCMRTVYSFCEEMSPTDYQYFKENGWFDRSRSYFCDNVRGNVFGNTVGKFIAWMMRRQFRKKQKADSG